MPSLEKALLTNTVTNERLPVLFNPEEYTLNKDVTYAQIGVPGLGSPLLQFIHGGLQTLEMELFLDTYEEHREAGRLLNRAGEDVRTYVRALTSLLDIEPTTHAPPVVLFTWASLSFTCVLARANQRFVMFLPDGTPVRARVQVAFQEFTNASLEPREVKRETADYSKVHVVGQGETLSGIAGQVYGNPRSWRAIALRNNVDDPRRLPTGLTLLIPQLPYRDRDTGEVHA